MPQTKFVARLTPPRNPLADHFRDVRKMVASRSVPGRGIESEAKKLPKKVERLEGSGDDKGVEA